MAAFRAAMGPLLSTVDAPALPAANWARLTSLVVSRGYTLVVSPALGGRAYRISIPLGDRRVEVYAGDSDGIVQVIDSLLIAVQSLPVRE
jgi:hypothetical protein